MMRFLSKITGALFFYQLLVGIFLILLIVLAAMVIKLGGSVKNMRTQAAVEKVNIMRLQSTRDEFLFLKSSIEKIEKQQANLISLVPTRKEVLNNIKNLEFIAAGTGNTQKITITDVPPDSKKTSKAKAAASKLVELPSNFDVADYTITLNGGFADFMRYLKLLEHQSFLTFIKSIDIKAETLSEGQVSRNKGDVETKIEGTFFFMKY